MLRPYSDLGQNNLYCKKLTLLGKSYVVEVLCPGIEVAGWIEPGKVREVMDKMRLVEIAAVHGQVRPFDPSAFCDEPQRPLKSTHAAKQLWRKTHSFIK